MNGTGQFVYIIPINQHESMTKSILETLPLRQLLLMPEQDIEDMDKQEHNSNGDTQMTEHTLTKTIPMITIPKRNLDFLELAMTTVGTIGFTIGIESLFNGSVFSFWRIITIALSLGLGAMLVISAVILQWYESRS